MKHISIRVPWHDNKWNGTVCSKASCNSYCMNLRRIFETRDNQHEDSLTGKAFSELSDKDLPACKAENGYFMNEHEFKRIIKHPYKAGPHADLIPTELSVEPYSFMAVPFGYLRTPDKDNQWFYDLHPEFKEKEKAPFDSTWIYDRNLQEQILTWFKRDIKPSESLVTFYCKNSTPVDEDSRRIIVGIGEVDSVSPLNFYNSKSDITYPFWDLKMSHTIRRDLKKSVGFLLPYHEYLSLDDKLVHDKTGLTKYQALEEIKITLEKLGNSSKLFQELSYGCNHVGNRNMLLILGAARKSLERVIAHNLVPGDWKLQIRWIDAKIGEIKKASGPFPGFAEALRAIGIDYAYLIEQDLREDLNCRVKDNPWEAFATYMESKNAPRGKAYSDDWHQYRTLWRATPELRRHVLELLSRFELNECVIKKWVNQDYRYEDLISNPYIISEQEDVDSQGAVSPEMIDFGVFEDPEIQGVCLPQAPSVVKSELDERRLRAIVVTFLKQRLLQGDTLVSLLEVEDYVSDTLQKDERRLPIDFFLTYKEFMQEAITYIGDGATTALQLPSCFEWDTKVSKWFKMRSHRKVKDLVPEDWDNIVKNAIQGYDASNESSVAALYDQSAALQKMYERKLSVLTGAAGTGKTSVVRAFLQSEAIQNEGVLLLAPTGKARVRLGSMGKGFNAQTIAQFLTHQKFFDWDDMKIVIPENFMPYNKVGNVIIDECSMLTIYDFYALFKALDLQAVKRIILIGDQYQLPPIGPGRPFADLCAYMDEHENGAYANLTTVVRTITTGDSDILQLARWFSGNKPQKDDDVIFDKMVQGTLDNDLAVYTWQDTDDLDSKLKEVLNKEMPEGGDFVQRFYSFQGIEDVEDVFANPSKVEQFQILSPVVGPLWGTYNLNSIIQGWNEDNSYPITIVNQQFGYRDKIIQLKNEKPNSSSDGKQYQLSNGQVGLVYRSWPKSNKLQAVFSGIENQTFDYWGTKSDDAEQKVELAYAITIHKSQGSDFDTVMIVLPESCPLLSRELIYTALTRAKKKLILFVQNNTAWLKKYTLPSESVLAKRNTNMFGKCSVRVSKTDIPFAEGLIHKTLDGIFVRSKSEVLIANQLHSNNIEYEYEKELVANGRRYIPDFTFVDAGGDPIIWEHLGMLDIPSYKLSWERKKAFYESIDFVEGENLFITQDHEGAIDSTEIEAVIDEIKELLD